MPKKSADLKDLFAGLNTKSVEGFTLLKADLKTAQGKTVEFVQQSNDLKVSITENLELNKDTITTVINNAVTAKQIADTQHSINQEFGVHVNGLRGDLVHLQSANEELQEHVYEGLALAGNTTASGDLEA